MSETGLQQPPPGEELDENFWEDLLAHIEEKQVIPIVGADLLFAQVDGRPVPLYRWIAAQLAPKLRLPAAEGWTRSLNEVICEFLGQRERREVIYTRLRGIMREAKHEPSQALRQLASITDFNLYVTTTFDSLLEQAINEVRFDGQAGTEVLAYAPNNVVDLPCKKERLPRPTVYHLLGKLAASPTYAISDEDILEFVCALQTDAFCPETLFEALENHHLLLLGCGFSNWLNRFFLRMAKGKRLSDPRDVGEVVADSHTAGDPDLVVFLQTVSSRTKIFRGGDASAFVAELWRRWSARQPAAAATSEAERPIRFLPPEREMPEDAIFISYAREDIAAVQELKAGLDAAGLTMWFDMDRLESGDDYDRKIQNNIRRCSFFLPIISAATQARDEGYFRREWHYAVERAKNMTGGALFILPIAIDETPEKDALVPEPFLSTHWTRVPGGKAGAELEKLAARLRKLTGKEQAR